MKVQVIIGSVRPGRVSERIATWVVAEAKKIDGFEVETVDLKDYPMMPFDEPVSPQFNPDRQPTPVVKKWLDKLGEAEAYVIVSPEYSRSIPGPMKNAIDYLDFQLKRKPVALVAHGTNGGAQAVSDYRVILPQLKAITVPEVTYLKGASELFNEDGVLSDEAKANPYGPATALKNTLEDLKWYGDALDAARTQATQAG